MGSRDDSTTKERLDCWSLAETAVDAEVDRLLLTGPPGVGKTGFATSYGLNAAADLIDLDRVFRVYLTEDTPFAELRGGPLPFGKEWRWKHGPAVQAWLDGKRLVLDEIDKAPGDVLTFLLAILDDPQVAGITLPNGEAVRPARGFNVIATMNGHADDLPEALRDRFAVAVHIDEPHPGAIASLPEDLRQKARVTSKLDAGRRISIRGWRVFGSLRERVGEETAAALVFGERAGDVLDTLKIAADADPPEPMKSCYWVALGECTGDGRGVYRDAENDPACATCALVGRSSAPITDLAGNVVRDDD